MKTLAVKEMLYVQDMDRAINFYMNAFHFELENRSDFWSNLTCGGGELGLTVFGNISELKKTNLILMVDDYMSAVKLVQLHGGTILKTYEPSERSPVWCVEIIDTENNQLVISQKVN